MLDPLFEFFARLFAAIAAAPRRMAARLARFFSVGPATKPDGTPRKMRHARWFVRVFAVGCLLVYFAPFVWHAAWIRGFDISYPQKVVTTNGPTVAAGQRRQGDAKACVPSQTAAMMAHLVRFAVEENAWVPSMPQYKFGLFGIDWDDTSILNDKAAFQRGLIQAMRRTSVELVDVLGRVRGTSIADEDLTLARNAVQADESLWWFNPFEGGKRVFGPTTPTPVLYAKAIGAYDRYNERLAKCEALFDARSDNLRAFFDRVANDLGSTAELLQRRSQSVRYDSKQDKFVGGPGNNRGWFDLRADSVYMYALGELYAYHGILQAVREDFSAVVVARGLVDAWDNLEEHVAEAAHLSPLIVSNGRPDGLLFPDHLIVLESSILRARTNIGEIRDILDR